jgi:FtsP/CotA-like multicopper oxidase with cupredoxin domain
VSPAGISDKVMRKMEPGESYDIVIAIPSDHIPGTNWYHPHAHGSANIQIASGCVGELIVESDFAGVPEIAAAKDRLLVLTEGVSAILPRNGSITFRSRFLDFTGKYMLHYHMMNHEELGMMQVVEVYSENQ